MSLYGWTCPECGTYHKEADAATVRGDPRELQVKCGSCGGVETIPGVVA